MHAQVSLSMSKLRFYINIYNRSLYRTLVQASSSKFKHVQACFVSFQAYRLCLMDYDFMILDNAFVLHNGRHMGAGGAERWSEWRKTEEYKITKDFHNRLAKAYVAMYGNRTGCVYKNSDFDIKEW